MCELSMLGKKTNNENIISLFLLDLINIFTENCKSEKKYESVVRLAYLEKKLEKNKFKFKNLIKFYSFYK